ncbi:unnamed protein product [Orchesella dallaii]|uniref:Uncharacterized protein n=1 Tax=Orchesella dallaii TaxID=48710 RepID=A0ABP1S362_9HEXA
MSGSAETAASSSKQGSMTSRPHSNTTLRQQLLSQISDQGKELREILRLQKNILTNTSIKKGNKNLKEVIHEEVTKTYINLLGVCVSTELLGKDSRKEIVGLRTQLCKLESGILNKMEDLEDQVSQLKGTVSNKMEDLEDQVGQLKGAVEELKQDVGQSNVERLTAPLENRHVNSNGNISEYEMNTTDTDGDTTDTDGEMESSAWTNHAKPGPSCSNNDYVHSGRVNRKLRYTRSSTRKQNSNLASRETLRIGSEATTMSAMSEARPFGTPTINQTTRYGKNSATARIQHLLTPTRLRPRTRKTINTGSESESGFGSDLQLSSPSTCPLSPSSTASLCGSDSSWAPDYDTIADRVKQSPVRKAACSFRKGF